MQAETLADRLQILYSGLRMYQAVRVRTVNQPLGFAVQRSSNDGRKPLARSLLVTTAGKLGRGAHPITKTSLLRGRRLERFLAPAFAQPHRRASLVTTSTALHALHALPTHDEVVTMRGRIRRVPFEKSRPRFCSPPARQGRAWIWERWEQGVQQVRGRVTLWRPACPACLLLCNQSRTRGLADVLNQCNSAVSTAAISPTVSRLSSSPLPFSRFHEVDHSCTSPVATVSQCALDP